MRDQDALMQGLVMIIPTLIVTLILYLVSWYMGKYFIPILHGRDIPTAMTVMLPILVMLAVIYIYVYRYIAEWLVSHFGENYRIAGSLYEILSDNDSHNFSPYILSISTVLVSTIVTVCIRDYMAWYGCSGVAGLLQLSAMLILAGLSTTYVILMCLSLVAGVDSLPVV